MFKQALTQFPAPWLMAFALGLFLVAMTLIVARVFGKKQAAKFEHLAHLPLSED